MFEEIKKIWVEALRSGRYRKGTRVLRNINNEFCCLGVLCDLYVLHTKKSEWVLGTILGTTTYYLSGDYDYEYETLPSMVVDWAGFDPSIISDGSFHVRLVNNEEVDITTVNDMSLGSIGTEFTFKQIADMIEDQL